MLTTTSLRQIIGHLDPLALLYMSRVNKTFRQLFTTKSAKPLWARARANLNLPDLRSDTLSEMAYATLMLERLCMVRLATFQALIDSG